MSLRGFDLLAPLYRWLEWGTYGGLLHWCRTAHLGAVADCRRALVIGDGDGRFLAALLRANRAISVDSLDLSPGMLALARREVARVPGGLARVRFILGDVRTDTVPSAGYDLVVTNFLLDCFPSDQLAEIVRRLAALVEPGGLWIVGDFAKPEHGWQRIPAQLALAGMYAFFRMATRIPARALVDPGPFLHAANFKPISRRQRMAGFLVASLWRKGTA